MLKWRFLYLINPSFRRVERPCDDQLNSDRRLSTVASGNKQ